MSLGGTSTPISHWYTLIEGLNISPSEFYKSVSGTLETRKVPDATQNRVDWLEAGMFSASREYLRMSRGRNVIDICGAPFGSGFFVAWWLAEPRPSPVVSTIAAFAVGLFLFFSLGFVFGFVALLALFVGIGAFISSTPEEEWINYLLVIPALGALWERFFCPSTYYRIDTALMFQTAVHGAVLEVIDGITQAKGLRALSESDRKPILKDFFGR